MIISFELGVSSSDAITLQPEYNYQASKVQLKSQHRTKSGKLFLYKWGDYKRFNINVDFMGSQNAAIVNSWWENNTELLLFVNSSSGKSDTVLDYSKVFSDYTWIEVTRGVTSLDYVKIIETSTDHTHNVVEHFEGLVPGSNIYYDIKLKASEKYRSAIYLTTGAFTRTITIQLSTGYFSTFGDFLHANVTSEVDDFWKIDAGITLPYSSHITARVMLLNSNGEAYYQGDGTSGIWAGDATLKGFLIGTEISSVMILNKDTPLKQFRKPYADRYKGRILLESY